MAEQKALRADLPKYAPSQSETTSQPKIPQLFRRLTEKEMIVAEGKIMMDMVLQGQRVDAVTNPLQQKQFVDEGKERRRKVLEQNRWILAGKKCI